MSVQTAGERARQPQGPQDFSHMQGMNELDAGAEIAKYIADQGGDDIDVFDESGGARRAPSEATPDTAPPPQEGSSPVEEEARHASEREETESDQETETQTDPGDAGPELEAATLASLFGVDEDLLVIDDDGVVQGFATTVDGERGQATLAELVKGYQTEANVTRRSQEVARQREQLEQEYQQKQQELQSLTQQTLATGQAMRDRILQKYEGVDWNSLRVQNPGEFAALQQQMHNEVNALQQETQMLMGQLQQQQLHMQHQEAERQRTWIAEQQAALFQHLPEMAVAETRDPLLNEYHKYLTSYGFNDDEVKGILDHRMLRVINDAVKYRRGLDGEEKPKQPLAKRLVNVPRVRKPGATATESGRSRDRAQAARRRLAQTGTERDAAIAMIESGIVDDLL